MQLHAFKLWYSHIVYCRKVIGLFLCLFFSSSLQAQEEGTNMLDHDEKLYYFGIVVGMNNSQYKVFHNELFLQEDSVKTINPIWALGLSAGLAANLRLNKHFTLRLIPNFAIIEKKIDYTLKNNTEKNISMESLLLHVPLNVKFCSDRIGNFRFYAMAGGKFDYDFNSNVRSRRNDEVLKIKPVDYGYELGIGFEFYNATFVFTPEIKISNGFGNVQKIDNSILTSKYLGVINSRMVMLSFQIGG